MVVGFSCIIAFSNMGVKLKFHVSNTLLCSHVFWERGRSLRCIYIMHSCVRQWLYVWRASHAFVQALRVQNRDYPHFRPMESGGKIFFSLFFRCFAASSRKICSPYKYVAFGGGFFCNILLSKAVSGVISLA